MAKLRGELEKERAAHAQAKIQFEVGLAQARTQQTEEWKALKEECQLREGSSLSEKAAFEAALEEEKGLRVAAETRIQALEYELKTARGTLSRTEADLNGARARIRSAVADDKNSPTFDNYVELKRQQWISDFQESEGYRNEIKFATLDGANRVLDKLKALHPE